jgi:hypothetical protein
LLAALERQAHVRELLVHAVGPLQRLRTLLRTLLRLRRDPAIFIREGLLTR